MKLARGRAIAALVLAFLVASVNARALVCVIEQDQGDAAERVVASPTTINFGLVEVSGTSKKVKVTLVNEDTLAPTTVSKMQTTDDSVKSTEAEDVPFDIAPNSQKALYFAYQNPTGIGDAEGIVVITYSIDVGTEELTIPFVVKVVKEGGLLKKPDEGLFLGPCFLETLEAR